MTTLCCTEDTLTITNEGRVACVSVEAALQATNDCDLIESIMLAWQNKGELVIVPNISNARGLKPRNSQRHGVIM
jgi:hypothetical protein